MKKLIPLLNTFFFGYLPLKWKRLARVLSILLYFLAVFTVFDNTYIGVYNIILFFGTPIFIMLLSWVLKPFIVKD